MGWSIGYDSNWNRDIGYGVPAYCDHPECDKEINRGLSFVCGGEPYGGEHGCGLFFCNEHLAYNYDPSRLFNEPFRCERCLMEEDPFDQKSDHPRWIDWKLNHSSWRQWRIENPEFIQKNGSLKPFKPGPFRLKFVTAGNNTASLGTFAAVTMDDLVRYVRENELSWIEA